ncbi:RING-5 domain-containing protein [Phanerochaete sordida]|uniref:RBR-type E3 ubiquitin transferase n=1 Tax=Phanerochaete sordida TaxID=48140 RepID=A0A9P3G879_9APHY|nr:RING-5 domain-containing protein [Phanerochaete sordida]
MSSDNEYSDQDYYDDEDEDVLLDDAEDESASEMDVDAFDTDYRLSAKGNRKIYEVEYESLSQGDIEKLMKDDVDNVSGIFGVDEDTASLLLRHFEWNKEKLIEKFMDNAAAVNAAAGLSVPEKPHPDRSQSSGVRRSTRQNSADKVKTSSKTKSIIERISPPVEERFVCPICFDDSQTEYLSLSCDHKFCTDCWNAYIASKIKTEAEQWITCMGEDCKIVAPNAFIRKSLKNDSKSWQRFQELLVRHFVSCNQSLKYCPYPSCTYTVSCPSASSKSSLTQIVPIVVCGQSPTHKFCFGCNIDDDHRPVVCGVARLWMQKCQDDSETANWIKSNTKECSKCQSTIEKNGGCNHMTCKKCKYEFCWVCMGPWSEHGTAWYSCNRYDEKASIDARDAQSKSRASLERYLHYYNRWANHEQSAKLSVELYAKTEKKMEEMQMSSDLTWIEVQFMKKAADEVFKCRMTLKWTYAMAYYLDSGNQKELYEDNQRDLERAVEELSELIEQPLDPEVVPSLRQKVTDKTVYVQKRNEIVLEDTAKGFLEGRWSWNVPVEGFD